LGDDERRGEGKLIRAARLWAGAPPDGGGAGRSARADPEEIAKLAGRAPLPERPAKPAPARKPFRVRLDGWDVFSLFLAAGRCWRLPAMGGAALGLDWCQVRALADGLGVAWDTRTIDLLTACETAACDVWDDKWRRDHPQ
jgi:hypothetical protein